jgi:serine/threonine-protein kinase
MSNESGTFEVYVRPFPGPGGKRQVSTAGGRSPAWSRHRRELFYQALDEKIMLVPYTVEGKEFRAEKAQSWSQERFAAPANAGLGLHPDGDRLAAIANVRDAEARQDHVVFILNFFDYLRQIAPPP